METTTTYSADLKFVNEGRGIYELEQREIPVLQQGNSVIYGQQYMPQGANYGKQPQPVVVQPVQSVVPQAQSVVPAVQVVQVPRVLQPAEFANQQYVQTYQVYEQPVTYTVQPQQPLPAPGTINGTVQINSGACSMLNDAKITALINETRKDVNKVTIPAASSGVSASGLILDLRDEQDNAWDVYFKMEEIIYHYKSVISDVYNNYINNNPNKGDLNKKFQDFSNELMDKIFEVITKYNKFHSFVTLCKKEMLTTPEEINKYNELLEENENNSLLNGKLCKEVYRAINEANGLLKSKLNEFNGSLKATCNKSFNK